MKKVTVLKREIQSPFFKGTKYVKKINNARDRTKDNSYESDNNFLTNLSKNIAIIGKEETRSRDSCP